MKFLRNSYDQTWIASNITGLPRVKLSLSDGSEFIVSFKIMFDLKISKVILK